MVNLKPVAGTPTTSASTDRRTRALLRCGIAAGPLFVFLLVIQGLSRDGFDLRVTPLSQLSLGAQGWIQITNLAISGILFGAAALGMRRALSSGRARTWSPLLVGVFAVCQLCSSGVLPDVGYGFPAGAPAGAPDPLSWHGTVHVAAVTLGGWALVAACLVYTRRFAEARQRAWVAYCLATAAADVALTVAGVTSGDYRLALVGHALVWLWPSVVAMRLLRERTNLTPGRPRVG